MGENDAGKVFVGGLPKGCSQEVLQNWASQFGAVSSVEIRCDQFGTPRGFGFVVFADPSSAEKVLQNHESNSIEGKWVDCKPIMAPGQIAAAKGGGKGANDPLNPPNKIFVGGLPKTATQESVTAFFSGFGALKEVLLKVHDDGQCKGYAFITFEELAPVEQLLQTYATNSFEGKWIDIKQAMTMPKGNDKGKGKGKGGYGDGWGMPSYGGGAGWGGGCSSGYGGGCGGYGGGCGGGYGGGCGGGCGGGYGGGYGGPPAGGKWGGGAKGAPGGYGPPAMSGGYGGPSYGGAPGGCGGCGGCGGYGPQAAKGAKGGKGKGPYW